MLSRFHLRALTTHSHTFTLSTCTTIHHGSRHAFTSNIKTNQRDIIVQKFGGTSLGNNEKMQKSVNIMKQFKRMENTDVVVVVSALSSDMKEEGTTSRLLQAAQNAIEHKEYQSLLNQIEDTHLDIIYTLLKPRKKREAARKILSDELNEIGTFCDSLSVIRELSHRSHDKIIGCGERMAASLTAAVLTAQGVDAQYVNLSYLFDDPAIDCSKRDFHSIMKQTLKTQIENVLRDNNKIPVITGFFGRVHNGMLNTIGRGYTDLTAALCAGAVNANKLQVWKESDGIFTGNPSKISEARLLSSVTPDEALELTSFGNEVLNPYTMRWCIEDKIAIQILNTFEPHKSGTTITPTTRTRTDEEDERYVGGHGIVAVCSKKNINVVNLSLNEREHQSLAEVFALFRSHAVKIDLISTSVSNVSVAVHESVSKKHIESVVRALKHELSVSANNVSVKPDRCIISCVGSGMVHQVGIAAKIFTCLSEHKVNIEMISQGSSEISISVVVHSKDMDRAIHAIHKHYIADSQPASSAQNNLKRK